MRRLRSAAAGAVVLVALAATLVGCSATAQIQPIKPQIGGHPYDFVASGHGSKHLSGVRAVGPVGYGASCVGSGSLTLTLLPTNLTIKVPCVHPGSNVVSAGADSGELPKSTTIRASITAAAGSSWTIAVGYAETPVPSPTPPAALSAVENPGDGSVVLKRLLSQSAGAQFTVTHIAQPRVHFDNVCWGDGMLRVTIPGVGSYKLACTNGTKAAQIGEGFSVPASKSLTIETSADGTILWSMTVIGETH